MLGVADLVAALDEKRPPRASGALALHVLDAMEAILDAAGTGQAHLIAGAIGQPEPLSEDEASRLAAEGLAAEGLG